MPKAVYATFDNFEFMPPELRKQFAELEDFIGNVDGKTIGEAEDDDTFFEEGTIDANDAVKAVNAVAAEIRRLLAIPAAQ